MPKAAGQLAAQDLNAGQGEETIIDNAAPAAPAGKQPAIAGGIQQGQPLAPAPTMLGMNNKAAQPGDGGFQGKVLVAPGGVAAADANDQQAQPAIAQPVSAQAPEANTPDDLYQRGYDALNRLDYPRAEANFKDFLASYPDHPLAGQTLFWLGESYWGEQNFAAAAKSYQDSYKQFPKSRRAPDAFLKLGLSLARLGQKDQACIIIGSVDSEYPSAIDVKKKAQAAFKREGCS
jgi:tol-pal system protein YbgF